MIAEFTIENFRSFKERHTFSFLATKNKELLESNTFEISPKQRLLKSAVIYGANASGKTNFFRALDFFLGFAIFSGPRKQVGDTIETDFFYFSRQTENGPASFELIFFLKNKDGKYIRYRYGFSVSHKEVITEYLFAVYNVREITLFTREKQDINTTDYFREGTRIKSVVRSNSSFLSVCAQNNGEVAAKIILYFQDMTVTSGLIDMSIITKKKLQNSDDEARIQILDFLHYADIQVKGIEAQHDLFDANKLPIEILESLKKQTPTNTPETETFFYGHEFYDNSTYIGNVLIPEKHESSGTQKLFAYSIPIISSLKYGIPLFIDEFDTQLHPLILESIIKLYNSPEKNKKNAQLIISCHAVNILTKKNFRRDQIWFCEKDQYGATDLYSLVEYDEPVRNDAAFGKNYLHGKYGAIPYINEIALQIGNQK
jgi:AAA15 family ATPase/GTPase